MPPEIEFGVKIAAGERNSSADAGNEPRPMRLDLEKTSWLDEFVSSYEVLVRGPVAPKEFLGDPFFRDCWLDQRFPRAAFAAAVAIQALLILFPPPIWNVRPPLLAAPPPQMELTWFGPVKDLPSLRSVIKTPKAQPKLKVPTKGGADAFHPRQTIISAPMRPTHPRQTLVQPVAPKEPPKILPALPNIVQLADSQPARPKAQLSAKQLAAMRPKEPASRIAPSDVAAPEVAEQEKAAGPINIASSEHDPPKPALPVSPMSAPHTTQQKSAANAAAPEIAGRTGDNDTLIALSATPAPAPPPAVPAGNLSARISISPDGPKPGAASPAKGNNGARGPEGIFIGNTNSANKASESGLGIGSASRGVGNPLPSRPRSGPTDSQSLPPDSAAHAKAILDMAPEKVLGTKKVYTLHVNMPNMTSLSGSWVLNFAELDENETDASPQRAATDLSWPVALRKVDPKYPQDLRKGNVEGEVVLYAIIRKDGSVDSIQLVTSVDPTLDANAMEALSQWKFEPARKHGEPIELEAVVHIPFRTRAARF